MSDLGPIRAVELFAGIGGFRIAADSLGLETVWANDIDPVALNVYAGAFGNGSLIGGDILDLVDQVPEHEILTAGFPCQPFSYAGKKAGTADERVDTFDAICQILKFRNPPVFVLENVRSLLSIAYGRFFGQLLQRLNDLDYAVEWNVINATDFGLPQNRSRVILVGWRPQEEREEWSDFGAGSSAESGNLLAKTTSFPSWGFAHGGRYTAADMNSGESQSVQPLSTVLERKVADRYDFTDSTRERIGSSKRVHEFIDGVEVLWNQEGGRRMGYTVFGVNGVAPTLTSSTSRHYERFMIDGRYRRLTPVEYARLQGFPDDHVGESVPHAKRYVLYGNAIPPPLAEWALRKAIGRLEHRGT